MGIVHITGGMSNMNGLDFPVVQEVCIPLPYVPHSLRLNALQISDEKDNLERTFLSPAHRKAAFEVGFVCSI